MREFFHGWRRKVGVVMLAIACMFAAGWIRSLSCFDVIYIPLDNKTTIGLVSAAGAVDFCRTWEHGSQNRFFFATGELELAVGGWVDETGAIDAWSNQHVIDWRFDWAGIRIGKSKIGDRHDFDCVLPYWSIIAPLTLLTAWLLLSKTKPKPRPTTSERPPA